jgi:hypothetical protein
MGTITPSFLDWKQFPIAAADGAELLRISYSGLPNPVRSWLWIRPVYPDGTVGRATKLYPNKDEIQLFEVELPDDFEAEGIDSRSFQIKKGVRYASERVQDPLWSATLESWERS